MIISVTRTTIRRFPRMLFLDKTLNLLTGNGATYFGLQLLGILFIQY